MLRSDSGRYLARNEETDPAAVTKSAPNHSKSFVSRSSDPELVARVREHLAAERRRELARLEPPVRPVPDGDPDEGLKP